MTGSFQKAAYAAFLSMLPVVELRGGIPLGAGMGLPAWLAYLAAVAGNMLPVPFIVLFVRKAFARLSGKSPLLRDFISRLEAKAHVKGRLVQKYRHFGLVVLVAVPLPGTGAWTGAMAAAFLDMRLRDAVRDIFIGVLAAGLIVTCAAYGVAGMLA